MKQLYKILFALLMGMLAGEVSFAQGSNNKLAERTVTFCFQPGKDMFFLESNRAELERLRRLVDEYRVEITKGKMPLYVDGYCASLPTAGKNLKTAYLRANRVKSELIIHQGLKEDNFITSTYAHAYHNNKDIVVVTLKLPEQPVPEKRVEQRQPAKERAQQKEQVVLADERRQEPLVEEPEETTPVIAPAEPYCFALRTNLLYDAFLLPTLDIEWRINGNVGIKFDGSLARWGGKHGKVQKMWVLNPELRWYMGSAERFYLGVGGNYGEYNIYKYMVGGILSGNTGYQGKFWNAGVTVGYQFRFSRSLFLDFNLGLGYTRTNYDSFRMAEGVRVVRERDKSKNCWGPTQAGISLVWTIGSSRMK